MNPIAFNTANLVARVTNYRFELRNWSVQHRDTAHATDEHEWRSICQEIAAHGFRSVEVWEAHAAPGFLNQARAARWKAILDEFKLQPIAYAASLRPETVEVARWLGIPQICGGLGVCLDDAERLCRRSGVAYNFENHPEKSAAEIASKVGGGSESLGVCIDTGWLGTQGLDAPQVLAALGGLVRHVHIKDVRSAGGHETVPLGEGVVDVERCLRVLKARGYEGALSWEDEPEERNPFEVATQCREKIECWLS